MKKELLAPAGDIEAGYAALYYGADAVYLGLKHFSARATAANFDEAELNAFVGYAHNLKRKVYAAVNTLVQESELPELLKSLDICSNCRVDGIILQDLGVARIIKEQYPELELHASTQMAVHNKQGALALQKMGFKRVVLARELSLAEIKDIASIPNLETEAFIHGALCYSYSGLCLFSSLESGRSANRGKCLYPCRSAFKGAAGEKHYFSMKDMALQDDVLKMPVTSLKIEGRKKNALYVAAVTDYYRNILDGHGAQIQKEENIKQIFSRPWCKFMFNGKDKTVVDRDFVGHRGLPVGKVEQVFKGRMIFHASHKISRHDGLQIEIEGQEKPFGFSVQDMQVKGRKVFEALSGDDVTVQLPPKAAGLAKGQKIYLASASEVKGGYDYSKPKAGEFIRRYPIDVEVDIASEKVTAQVGGVQSCVNGSFEKAENPVKTEDAVKKAFAKTGDTVFELKKLTINNPQGLFVPVSLLNELRRDLYEQIKPSLKHGILPEVMQPRETLKGRWIVRTDNVSCLSQIDLSDVAEVEIFVGLDTELDELKALPKSKIRIVLPALARNAVQWEKKIKQLLESGYKKWTIGNWWALSLLPERGIDLAFDSSLYVMNSQASAMAGEIGASRVTLSVEDTLDNLQKLSEKSPLPTVFPIYGDFPLFSSAVCIRENPCAKCPKGTRWMMLQKDGKTYWALSQNCQTFVFDDKPLCFSKEAQQVKADFYRVDFCYKNYPPEKAAAIWERVKNFKDVPAAAKGNINNNRF